MFCSKCGYKIPAGAAFCPNCGAKVQAEEAVHHSDAPSNAAQPGTEDQPDTEPSGQSGQPAAQTEQGTQTEPESQPDAVPTAGPTIPPAAPQPVQNGAQPAGDPLAVMVGKHADYYLAEFKKIDAGQKTRFNWAALLFGPIMCFYRRSGELFKKYFLPVYIALLVSSLVLMVGMSSLNGPVAVVSMLLALASCVWGLINAIRFGRNFNRDYYAHCKQQLAKPASERKGGTSIKNIVFFLLALTGIEIVLSIVGGLLAMLMLSATLNSAWENESSYSEDTYSESSSYYDEADFPVEEMPYDEEDIPADENLEEAPPMDLEDDSAVGSLERIEKAWESFTEESGELTVTAIGADCDCDGLNEGFAVTAEDYDAEMGCYFRAKIYFIDSYGNVTLLCDTSPEGGALYGYPVDGILSPDSTDGFFVWDLFTGASNLSLVWGVQDGQAYESDISGQYNGVQLADTWGLAGYQFDYSQGYRDYAVYRLGYDNATKSFEAIPDSAAYPAGEGPLA